MKIHQIALLSLVFLLTCCIKEVRDHCPCYLTLDLSGTPEEVDSLYLILQYPHGELFRDTIYREEFISDYEIAVPRGEATVAAYGNISSMIYDNGYIIPYGEEADNVYTCFASGAYISDLGRDTITVTKNFIRTHIKVLTEVKSSFGLWLEVWGSNIGYSLDGKLVKGKFYHAPECRHTPSPSEDYYLFSSRIPRHHGDAPLYVTLLTQYQGTDEKFKLLEISLMDKLHQAGISMNDPILQDLYFTIDHSRSTISISVDDFDSMDHVEVEF
jgi:hypothetical protein